MTTRTQEWLAGSCLICMGAHPGRGKQDGVVCMCRCHLQPDLRPAGPPQSEAAVCQSEGNGAWSAGCCANGEKDRAVADAVAREREECAKLADACYVGGAVAKHIRARARQ